MGLLERASALTDLERWLVDAQAGRGRLVLVEGEAGVGKTSLLNEFTARHRVATRSRLLWSGCDPLTTPRPLGPLVDLAAEGGREIDERAERARRAQGVAAAPERRRDPVPGGELGEQRGLADAGLALDEHEPPVTTARVAEPALEIGQRRRPIEEAHGRGV